MRWACVRVVALVLPMLPASGVLACQPQVPLERVTLNFRELERMHSYTASKSDALKFASAAGLRRESVEYLPAASGKDTRATIWGGKK